MSSPETSFRSRIKDFFENLFALKVLDTERVRLADDPLNLYDEEWSDRRPLRVATVLAILFHLLLMSIVFPSFGRHALDPSRDLVVLAPLAEPAAPAGGGQQPEAAPVQPPVVPDPQPVVVPIPDPVPQEPQPIERQLVEVTPPVIDQMTETLQIGEITAPPGPPGRGGDGTSETATAGAGPAEGARAAAGGDGPYTPGGGVTSPQILVQTTPSYTDEAIKAKVQGVVWLQAVIRRDGSVGSFKVLRGLGFGLEEKAIQEIANNWKFRPGMRNGEPVDVLATIEVQFTLR